MNERDYLFATTPRALLRFERQHTSMKKKRLEVEREERELRRRAQLNDPQGNQGEQENEPAELKSRLQIPPPKIPYRPLNDGHQYVGKHPFRIMISGKTGAGKGVLLAHLMREFYAPFFKRIYIFSPTFENDPTFENRNWQPSHVFTEWDGAELLRLVNMQDEARKEKKSRKRRRTNQEMVETKHNSFGTKRLNHLFQLPELNRRENGTRLPSSNVDQEPTGDPMLIIVDDFAADPFVMKSAALVDVAFSGRHKNISLIILTQKYIRVNTNIRTNLSLACLFRPTNRQEMDAIADEQSCGGISRRDFRIMFAQATEGSKHDFLTVFHDVDNEQKVFRKGLGEVLQVCHNTKTIEDQTDVTLEDGRPLNPETSSSGSSSSSSIPGNLNRP